MESVVEFEKVWKIFVKREFLRTKKVEALKGISLRIKRGEVFGFVGPNGAGKTTSLRLIMGFIRPSRGKVIVFGHPPGEVEVKRLIGYLPESPRPPGHLRGNEFLEAMAFLSGLSKKEVKERTSLYLELFGLKEAGSRLISSYSKGMIQKLALSAALIHDPEFIILDEPTSGLDPEGRKFVLDLVEELRNNGKTVIFSTHILSDVNRLCDRIGLLVGGELVKVMETSWFQRDFVLVEFHDSSGFKLQFDRNRVIPLDSSNGTGRMLIESSYLREFKEVLRHEQKELVRITSYLPHPDEILTSEIKRFQEERK